MNEQPVLWQQHRTSCGGEMGLKRKLLRGSRRSECEQGVRPAPVGQAHQVACAQVRPRHSAQRAAAGQEVAAGILRGP